MNIVKGVLKNSEGGVSNWGALVAVSDSWLVKIVSVMGEVGEGVLERRG